MQKAILIYKKISALAKPYHNEKGFIMGAVILLSLMLLIIVTMAIWSSNNETQIVRNTGIMTQEFYDAESGLVGVLNNKDEWLLPEFINANDDEAFMHLKVFDSGKVQVIGGYPAPTVTPTPTGKAIAEVQIRHMTLYDPDVGPTEINHNDVWEETNQFPSMAFKGTSLNGESVDAYRFVITSKDLNGGNSTVQIGVSLPTIF